MGIEKISWGNLMNYLEVSQALFEVASRSSRMLVLSHANPDADAIASILAFQRVFASDSRTVDVAIGPGTIPATLEFLPDLDRIQLIGDLETHEYDLLVLLDCADEGRTGEVGEQIVIELGKRITVVNIDHHVTNREFGDLNIIDPEAAATCEILTLLFEANNVEIDSELATILLAGVQGDTLGLRTPSTTGRTLDVSADLLYAGADLHTIVDYLFRVRPFSTIKLWGQVLYRVSMHGPLVWTEITPEMLEAAGADESEGEGIVNFLAGTAGARAAALLYQKPDGWRVSMRSLADDVDVAELAGLFGGGGHSRAAGCSLEAGIDARNRFLDIVADRIALSPASAD
jgi:bifunctional oligoribonuclease and PAP phosphatase NrnA